MRDYHRNLVERNRFDFPPKPFKSIKKQKKILSEEFNIKIDADWIDDLGKQVNTMKLLEL